MQSRSFLRRIPLSKKAVCWPKPSGVGVGQITEKQIALAFEKRGMISRKTGGVELCTSRRVLAEEVGLISFVRSGRGKCVPVRGRGFDFKSNLLSAEQSAAVRHLLTSRDQVMLLRGGAGVGKTTLMREAVSQIEARGHKVFAFAPSASASRETLRAEGSPTEPTPWLICCKNKEVQRATKGQFIWIDEAGLLGTRDLWRVMQLAGSGTRVILSGDHGQHAPVAREIPSGCSSGSRESASRKLRKSGVRRRGNSPHPPMLSKADRLPLFVVSTPSAPSPKSATKPSATGNSRPTIWLSAAKGPCRWWSRPRTRKAAKSPPPSGRGDGRPANSDPKKVSASFTICIGDILVDLVDAQGDVQGVQLDRPRREDLLAELVGRDAGVQLHEWRARLDHQIVLQRRLSRQYAYHFVFMSW